MKNIAMALGLAADAPEAAIVAAVEQLKGERAQAKSLADAANQALAAADKTAADERRAAARLEAEVERLSKESEARATSEWHATVDAAVKDFRLTPAEGEEHKALAAGAERNTAAKLLKNRQPQRPAAAVATLPTAPGASSPATTRGTVNEGLTAAQLAAVEAHKKANPGADDYAALSAVMAANPALFADAVEG